MSNTQNLLIAIADAIREQSILACELYRLAECMNGVSEYDHMNIALAAFGGYRKEDSENA